MGARVVVVDPERAIAEAIASALQASRPDLLVEAGYDASGAAAVVRTWPCDASPHTVVLFGADATSADTKAAQAVGAIALVSRTEPLEFVADAVHRVLAGSEFVSPAVAALLAAARPDGVASRLTKAEMRVLTELATRPDTRSRLAARLGISTSTLDNHLGSIKRTVLDELLTSENAPADGYLSIEALIGWATRQPFAQKT